MSTGALIAYAVGLALGVAIGMWTARDQFAKARAVLARADAAHEALVEHEIELADREALCREAEDHLDVIRNAWLTVGRNTVLNHPSTPEVPATPDSWEEPA